MAEQIALGALNVVKQTLIDTTREYIRYVGSCEENLGKLRLNLKHLCDKKDDIDEQVMNGKDQLKHMTRQAVCWVTDVSLLTEDEELRSLMSKDEETAKFVVKLMEKKCLKRLLKKDRMMWEVVKNAMNKLEEEMVQNKAFAEQDYKRVGEIVVEVIKDATEVFKEFLKNNPKMAAMATRKLTVEELEKLTNGDLEMEEIVRDARFRSANDDDDDDHDEYVMETKGLLQEPEMGEKERKLLSTMGNVLMPLQMKIMEDASFKKGVPEADTVKLGVEFIQGFLLNMKGLKDEIREDRKQHRRSCGYFGALIFHYHNLYKISIAAEEKAMFVQKLIEKSPSELVVPIRTQDMKLPPSHFRAGMDSRDKLLQQIVEKLKDDQVRVVGVFGMGGTGKTTLAKEVHKRAKDLFKITVMVEVSQTPDIGRIQQEIGESIDIDWRDKRSVAERAILLYNRLISNKEEKILIILDNIWKKLDLDEIGIPRHCKILLTTREKKVCKDTDVHEGNILEVGLLNIGEARYLFKTQAGKGIDDKGYDNVVERLLSKCGGLPLAIVATSNAVKDKDLSHWRAFANELEKPVSSQVGGEHKDTYSILETSFKFWESDEKRMFFLLACLSPVGSSISIEDLMRFGIGLDLFQHVDKLSEAIEQANRWADELLSSSMLLEGDDLKGHVKIHDVVRSSAVSFATKDSRHKFLVDAIPRWINDKTFKTYTAISLLSGNDYSRLNGVQAYKLQILLLKGNLSPDFPNSFFEGMVNLEILALLNMNFHPCLPKSVRRLKKLKSLELKGCRLGDIKWIGELVNLVVLSLRESLLDQDLPRELAELCNLRLLDLTGCKGNLSQNSSEAFNRLSKLEGLYMYDCIENQQAISCSGLHHLNVLHLHVLEIKHLPIVGQSFAEHLDEFRVCAGSSSLQGLKEVRSFHRVLDISNTIEAISPPKKKSYIIKGNRARAPVVGKVLEESCLKALLKKAEWLRLCGTNFDHLVPELDESGFRDLRYLEVTCCQNVNSMVSTKKGFNLIAFPHLETLNVNFCPKINKFCDGEYPVGMFSNLQNLSLLQMVGLEYVLPLSHIPLNLTKLEVERCDSLNFIFVGDASEPSDASAGEEGNKNAIKLSSLKSIILSDLPCLKSLLGPEQFRDSGNDLQEQEVLFSSKILFPALEAVEAIRCPNFVKLWSKEFGHPGFDNLRTIFILQCNSLTSIGPASMISTLEQLESLTIQTCPKLVEIITHEESGALDQTIRFPRLKYINISSSESLQTFYGGNSKLEFPMLRKLELYDLESMSRFAGSESSSAFFHEKIEFPVLEELAVQCVSDNQELDVQCVSDNQELDVQGVSDNQELDVQRVSDNQKLDDADNLKMLWTYNGRRNPVPMLKKLTLGMSGGLAVIPSMMSENLSRLAFNSFVGEFLFPTLGSITNEGSVSTNHKLHKVEELSVWDCDFKDLFEKADYTDAATSTFCVQLKGLWLNSLPELNLMPLYPFKGLCSLHISGLGWENLIVVDTHVGLQISLQQLETLTIKSCEQMKEVIKDEVNDPKDDLVFEFPKLKKLELEDMKLLNSFSTTMNTINLRLPSLESLIINECCSIHHFWSGSLVAPKLKYVTLKKCEAMEWLFSGNESDHSLELPSLQKIDIWNCPKMMSFSSVPLGAPQLREVKLNYCFTLQWLLLRNSKRDNVQEFPSLEIVDILSCPNIKAFSNGPLRAPKLDHVRHEREQFSRLEVDDLSQLLSDLQRKH